MTSATKSKLRRALSGGRERIECHYCGRRMFWYSMTLDHVIPRTAGGTDELSNLLLCCKRCNNKKGSRSYGEYVTVAA